VTVPGRENLAEISRLCRALVARSATLVEGTDPARDDVISGILDDIDALPTPQASLWYLASMIQALRNRLNRVLREAGDGPPMTFLQMRDALAVGGQTSPALLDDVFAILREVEVPLSHRDQAAIDEAVGGAGERWGHAATFTLSHIYIRLGRTVVLRDPTVETLEGLIADLSVSLETDLIESGED